MDSISSGVAGYADTLFQWQDQRLREGGASKGSTRGGSAAASLFNSSSSMTRQVSSMVELTRYVMNAMGLDGDSRVTFSQLAKYREQLQDEFNAAVGEGLRNAGIDPNVKFSVQLDACGNARISSSDEDAAKLQAFFDENPEIIKKYKQIEALAGIDDARKAMQISPAEMRKRIQIESMASWWAGSGEANSYFGNYSNENLSLMSGLNLSV